MTIGEKTIKNVHFLHLTLEKTLLNEETRIKWKCQNFAWVFGSKKCPKKGPNESFCGCLAQKVNEEGWETKTEQHLINCTESTLK